MYLFWGNNSNNMESELKLLKVSITNVLALVKNLSNQQLNEIPNSSSNNLIWHLGHLVVTHKLLIYGLSGNDLGLETNFVDQFKKGSKPNVNVSENECETIKNKLKAIFLELEDDLKKDIFKTFKKYPTSYNFEITNLNDAISFNNLHFGLHVGSILKLKKQIK